MADLLPEDITGTELDPRYQGWWRTLQEKQLTLAELEAQPDDILLYISGHRQWEHPGRTTLDDTRLGTQQKVRGNALRAADVLAGRQARRQLEALEASNHAVADSNAVLARTARATWVLVIVTAVMAAATIAIAIRS